MEATKQCTQCREVKPLTDYYRHKSAPDRHIQICAICYVANRQECIRQQEEEWERRQPEREHRLQKMRELQEQAEQRQQREQRRQEQGHLCHDCGSKYIPWGEAFDNIYCQPCHTKHFARSPWALCPICKEKKLYLEFSNYYQDYSLRRDGANIYLYCSTCEKAFLALSEAQQTFYIRSRCNLAFPSGQVIYGLVDPESSLIRYIGRTHTPTKRLQKHLVDRCEDLTSFGDGPPYYGRPKWMHDLYVKGLQPTLKVLREVTVAPQVIEWERRYIYHGLQQGWMLTNMEIAEEKLVIRCRASKLNFLQCSFESLEQEGFIRKGGIEAFVHLYYR